MIIDDLSAEIIGSIFLRFHGYDLCDFADYLIDIEVCDDLVIALKFIKQQWKIILEQTIVNNGNISTEFIKGDLIFGGFSLAIEKLVNVNIFGLNAVLEAIHKGEDVFGNMVSLLTFVLHLSFGEVHSSHPALVLVEKLNQQLYIN